VPESYPNKKMVIDKAFVENRLSKIAKDRDLSRYIL
jgi:ATP-dependent HslUV protease ATP-binding subunit HslU